MKLKVLADELALEILCCGKALEREVRLGYASDLLSDVIAHAEESDIWVTLQVHPNIVAVAMMKSLAAIVLVGGRTPQAETLAKAEEEEIPLLRTALPAFELVGRMYALGVRGLQEP